VHSATASYKSTRGYFDVLGGRFIGHGPVEAIKVRPAAPTSRIFAEVPAFTVHDELYLHELWPDIEVHFTARHGDNDVPVVWTRTVAAGRVCYSCPGHRSASLKDESVRSILRLGLQWLCRV
jgi:type 1 glutamine amidotransferase